jgi:hypothetical protein
MDLQMPVLGMLCFPSNNNILSHIDSQFCWLLWLYTLLLCVFICVVGSWSVLGFWVLDT